jgi:hypothetical protein
VERSNERSNKQYLNDRSNEKQPSDRQPKRDTVERLPKSDTVERSIKQQLQSSKQQQEELIRLTQANQPSTRIPVVTRQSSTTRIPIAINQQTNSLRMAKMKGTIDTMRTKMSSLYISERNGDSRAVKGATVPRGMTKKTVNLNMSKNTVHTHEANGANRKTPPTKSHTKVDEDGL